MKNMKNAPLGGSLSYAEDFIFGTPTMLKDGKPTKPKDGLAMEHWLDDDELVGLVHDIYNRCHIVTDGRSKEIILDNLNGKYQNLERNYTNFETVLLLTFRQKRVIDGELAFIGLIESNGFFGVDLKKLFEVIKTKDVYGKMKSKSIFFKKDELYADHDQQLLTHRKKINYNFNIDSVDDADYHEIVDGVGKHWQGFLPTLLDHMVASIHAKDGKAKWLTIIWDSDKGKSKIFKFIENFSGAVFLKPKDVIQDGISDLSVESLTDKIAFVFDEQKTFPRDLFTIENSINIRPMMRHTIQVPIFGRYFLTAEGGVFDNEYLESQIRNRVGVKDLRNGDTTPFGKIAAARKHGETKIELVMTHWLYTQIKGRMDSYDKLNHLERLDKSQTSLKRIFEENKVKKDSWFDFAKKSLQSILANPKESLDSRTYQEFMDAYTVTEKGIYIARPATIVPMILISHDASMAYELKHKTVKEIAIKSGWKLGSHYYGEVGGKKSSQNSLFIPNADEESRREKAKEVLDEMTVGGNTFPIEIE